MIARFRHWIPALILLTPLVYAPFFYQALITPKHVFFLAALTAALFATRLRPVWSPALAFITIVTCWFWLHTLIAGERFTMFHWTLALFPVYYELLLNVTGMDKENEACSKAVIFTGAVLAGFGIFRLLAGELTPNLTGNNQFSGLVILCSFPILLWKFRMNAASLAGLALFSVYPLFTRSLLLWLIMAGCVFLKAMDLLTPSKRKYLVATGIVILSALFVWNIGMRGMSSKSFRYEVWKSACRMIAQNPAGVGLNRFGEAYHLYRSEREFELRGEDTVVENAHNEILNLLAEGGLFLVPALLLAVVILAVGCFSSKNRQSWFHAAAFLIVTAASMVSFPFHAIAATVPLLYLVAGIEHAGEQVRVADRFRFRLMPFVILPILMCILPTYRWAAADRMLQKASINQGDSVRFLQMATELNPDPEIEIMLGDALSDAGRNSEALNAYLSAGKKSQFNPYLLEKIGWCLISTGDFQRALPIYRKALEILPWSKRIRENAALLEKKQAENM
ncbi:MAG: O-antigen ligase family protein [Candidatus Wallbacteria bacterium]|nr:O-antigen ligase family protein [Candidatus Wallbacteria bacterium]